jgi:hypothetical protein
MPFFMLRKPSCVIGSRNSPWSAYNRQSCSLSSVSCDDSADIVYTKGVGSINPPMPDEVNPKRSSMPSAHSARVNLNSNYDRM